MRRIAIRATLLTLLATASASAQLTIQSYTMRNGGTGSFAYWDRNYTVGANTNVSNALLQGGVGKLTDGVISTSRWETVSNAQGTGEYVGWGIVGSNPPSVPVITTFFSQTYLFTRLRLWVDHAGGFGGVVPPVSVIVGGVASADWMSMTGGTSFAVTPPAGTAPFLIDLDLTGLNLTGTSLTFQITRPAGQTWTMMSEMAVDGIAAVNVVPEPATIALQLAGFAVVGVVARRTRRRGA